MKLGKKESLLLQNFTEFEAEQFFNYYFSNGWFDGGTTPLVNWQATA